MKIPAGTTSFIKQVFVPDSSSAVGAGLTGLAWNTASLTAYYKRSDGTAAVAIALATIATLGTWETGGFKEVDATNMPGVYELHPPNAAIASGASSVTIILKGAANMAPVLLEIDLVQDKVDATQLAGQTITAAAGVTFPSSVASPTNITAASGVQLAADQDVRNVLGNITGNMAGNVGGDVQGNVDGSVGSVLGAVATVTDKAGYALTAAYDPTKTAAQAGDSMTLTVGAVGDILAALEASTLLLRSMVATQNAVDVSALGAVKTQDAGAGAITYTDTITGPAPDFFPIDDVAVWVTTDEGGTNTIGQTRTTALGGFTFYLNAGTYYLRFEKAGFTFTNPTQITVA